MYYLSDAERALLSALYADLRQAANQPDRMDPEITRKQDLAGLQADALAGLISAYEAQTAKKPVPNLQTNKQMFNLILTDCGHKKIQVIKEVRGIVPGLGLKEAKDMVDKTSSIIGHNRCGVAVILRRDVEEEEARYGVQILEEAGAVAHYERSSATPEEIQAARDGMVRVYQELIGTEAPCECGNVGRHFSVHSGGCPVSEQAAFNA